MKRYHGMRKYQQINFFPNVVKDVRPTYGNKEELAPLNSPWIHTGYSRMIDKSLMQCTRYLL